MSLLLWVVSVCGCIMTAQACVSVIKQYNVVLASGWMANRKSPPPHHNRLRPFFWDHPGEPVPEENFWTVWCKGRLTEADIPTIHPAGCHSIRTNQFPPPPSPIFVYRPDALPATQPTVSKHWRPANRKSHEPYHFWWRWVTSNCPNQHFVIVERVKLKTWCAR